MLYISLYCVKTKPEEWINTPDLTSEKELLKESMIPSKIPIKNDLFQFKSSTSLLILCLICQVLTTVVENIKYCTNSASWRAHRQKSQRRWGKLS